MTQPTAFEQAKAAALSALDGITTHQNKMRQLLTEATSPRQLAQLRELTRLHLAHHTNVAEAVRYLDQTVNRPVKDPVRTAILRGDPAGVVAAIFVITGREIYWTEEVRVPHIGLSLIKGQQCGSGLSPELVKVVDAIVAEAWPHVLKKHDLPNSVKCPQGVAEELVLQFKEFRKKHTTHAADAHILIDEKVVEAVPMVYRLAESPLDAESIADKIKRVVR